MLINNFLIIHPPQKLIILTRKINFYCLNDINIISFKYSIQIYIITNYLNYERGDDRIQSFFITNVCFL